MSNELVSVSAIVPAKLNLGLAIVGRRDDGFHELVTIMQTIALCDRLLLTQRPRTATGFQVALVDLSSGASGVSIDDPKLNTNDNLAVQAATATLYRLGAAGTFQVGLEKGIPSASGMGGASADAAAAILLTERLVDRSLAANDRLQVAADLGSDVPFFLTGGTALVTGRGEHVEALPPVSPTSFIVVFPQLDQEIPRKTARLFGALSLDDFSDGELVRTQASRVVAGRPISPELLGNGFDRALMSLAPELVDLREQITGVTGRPVALSGAGPTHYVLEPDSERAEAIAATLRDRLGDRASVFVCRPWDGPPLIQSVPTRPT